MGLRIWAVRYDTSDYPDRYVARLFEGEQAQESVVISDDLEVIRDQMLDMGLVSLQPMDGDDENLVETWL